MKKPLLFTFVLLLVLNAFGQNSNLIFFSEQGQPFYVILNGIRQNANPETNVKITDLVAPTYKVKIIFADQALGEFDKTVYFNNPATEVTFNVKQNKKGEWVMRFVSEVPVTQAPPATPAQSVIVYSATPPVQAGVTTTTTTTTTSDQPGGSVSMGVNLVDPLTGSSVNINAVGATSGTTVTQTTVSSSSSSTVTTTGGVVAQPPVVYVPGYTGAAGCPVPISPQEFMQIKQSIASKTFEDTKATIAKQIVTSKCLLCSQVKEIMMLFDFEDTRLDFAKFAYPYTYDIGNYYQLNDAFTFESSIEELNEYINGR